MWLKVIIVFLFLGIIGTLAAGFYTLLVDQGGRGKRTANLLLIRVCLAGLLIVAVIYGVWSGDLQISAPWYKP